MAGLLDVAVTDNGCPVSLAGPALMPVRLTTWSGASSLSVSGLIASMLGGSLIARTVTVKLRVKMLLAFCPSLTVTVMALVPKAPAIGVKVKDPNALGLV